MKFNLFQFFAWIWMFSDGRKQFRRHGRIWETRLNNVSIINSYVIFKISSYGLQYLIPNQNKQVRTYCLLRKAKFDSTKLRTTGRAEGFLIKRVIIIEVSLGRCLMFGCNTLVSNCLEWIESVVQHIALSIFFVAYDVWKSDERVIFHAKSHSGWLPCRMAAHHMDSELADLFLKIGSINIKTHYCIYIYLKLTCPVRGA